MNPTQEAVSHITTSCRRIGAFHGTTDVNRFLKQVASDMAAAQSSVVFPDRYLEHVAYAVDMVASNIFTSAPAAIASVYLATRFEFYFRILSGKLRADGTWATPQAKNEAKAALGDRRLGGGRVSSIALAYKIMKLNQSLKLAQLFEELDNELYANPSIAAGEVSITDIGERIEYARHRVGHGILGDISSESLFYGLVTAIVFYNQA